MKASLKIHEGQKQTCGSTSINISLGIKQCPYIHDLNKQNQSITNKENDVQDNMNSEEGELNGDLEEGEL